MPVTKGKKVEFAKYVAEEFLRGKEEKRITSLSQDEIDAYVVPIMTEVEDMTMDFVSQRILASNRTDKLSPTDSWWE